MYVQPATRRDILTSLDLAARSAIESHIFSGVVIAGDLNSTEEELRDLLPISEIMFVRTPARGTRVDANGVWSKLDYVCSTAWTSEAERYEHLSGSDHSPIGCLV